MLQFNLLLWFFYQTPPPPAYPFQKNFLPPPSPLPPSPRILSVSFFPILSRLSLPPTTGYVFYGRSLTLLVRCVHKLRNLPFPERPPMALSAWCFLVGGPKVGGTSHALLLAPRFVPTQIAPTFFSSDLD